MTQLSPGAPSGALPETFPRHVTDANGTSVDVVRDRTSGVDADAPLLRAAGPAPRRVVDALPVLTVAVDAVAAVGALVMIGAVDRMDLRATLAVVASAMIWIALIRAFGMQRASWAASARGIVAAGGVAGFLLAVLAPRTDAPLLIAAVGTIVAAAVVIRAVTTTVERRAGVQGRLRVPTAIVDAGGDGSVGDLFDGATDMSPIVVVDVAASLRRQPRSRRDAVPTIEVDVRELDAIVSRLHVGCVLVVGALPQREMEALRRAVRHAGAEFRVAVETPALPIGTIAARSAGRTAVLSVGRPHHPFATFVKRAMDVMLASLLLILASPLLLMLAAAIKLTSRGPVTFRQWRVTRGGRPFKILKFRTMDPNREVASSTAQPFFKLEDDPRLTPIGRVIRRMSLDELPQLWNVIRGDMSLVGPRPLPIEQVRAYPELLGPRTDVRAGITGWWQVNGRSDVDPEEAVSQDLFYIENWSLGFDVRILARTLPAIFTQRGAY